MADLFQSFFQGGFECSSHRRRDGRRLDVLAASGHEQHAEVDYRCLQAHGIRTVRDGLRWHRIEAQPGRYDWSSFVPMLRAAEATGTQVVWDLCHYGYPDDLDPLDAAFPERFARFAGAAARLVRDETDAVPVYVPINEISFWAWASDVGYLNPFALGQGDALKRQLVRAALQATDAIWAVDPRARIVHTDPVIHVQYDPARPDDCWAAEGHRQAQFQAWDMLAGRREPDLGGDPRYLDILGVNYYVNNQKIHHGPTLEPEHPFYRPFRALLYETYARYQRPLVLSETGIEGERRPSWLAYIGQEVRAAMKAGVAVEGLCWYPILCHYGWDDDRYCPNGLLELGEGVGCRPVYAPLAREWQHQQALFAALRTPALG